MNDRPGEMQEDVPPSETGALARTMANHYGAMVQHYWNKMQCSLEEADLKVRSMAEFDRETVLEAPVNQINWGTLGEVAAADPERAWQAWARIKAEAWHELKTGHRAAEVFEREGSPWERARFLTIWATIYADVQPRGGVEESLVDTMAIAQNGFLTWMERLHMQSIGTMRKDFEPRLDDSAAMEQSSAMADRFNRMFLRSLRALRDLRRYAPTVVVQNAGQVNVGGQQVNVGGMS